MRSIILKLARICTLSSFINGLSHRRELSLAGLTELEKGWTQDLPEWISITDIDQIKSRNSVDSLKIIQTGTEGIVFPN